jgi:hypothetical protein
MNKFIKCACYGHLMELEYDREYNQYYLTIWSSGFKREKLSWYDRIRWIWNILKTGNPWSDMFIINESTRKEIVEFLDNKNVEKVILKG